MGAKPNLVKDHKSLFTDLMYAKRLSNTLPLKFPKVKRRCDDPPVAYVAFAGASGR